MCPAPLIFRWHEKNKRCSSFSIIRHFSKSWLRPIECQYWQDSVMIWQEIWIIEELHLVNNFSWPFPHYVVNGNMLEQTKKMEALLGFDHFDKQENWNRIISKYKGLLCIPSSLLHPISRATSSFSSADLYRTIFYKHAVTFQCLELKS